MSELADPQGVFVEVTDPDAVERAREAYRRLYGQEPPSPAGTPSTPVAAAPLPGEA